MALCTATVTQLMTVDIRYVKIMQKRNRRGALEENYC